MREILDLARKDLLLLTRERAALFWTLAWPLVFALFFGFIMSGGSGGSRSPMSIAVVDSAHSAAGDTLLAELRRSESVAVEEMAAEEARDAVRRGRKVAMVVIPPGYGEGLQQFSGEGPALRVGVDPSRKAESGFLQGILAQTSAAVMQSQMQDKDAIAGWSSQVDSAAAAGQIPPEVADPLRNLFASVGALQGVSGGPGGSGASGFGGPQIEEEPIARLTTGRPRSTFDITFPSAILWALISCSSTFAVSLVLERGQGTLLRLYSAPLGRMRILFGKALACFLACLLTATLLLLVGIFAFRVHIGSPVGVAVALVAASACFTGLMMMFSAAGRTPQAVGGVSWASMLVFAMIGGGMIPLIAMPGWMQTVSAASPVRWGIYTIEGAIWRDFTAAEMGPPLLVLFAIGVVAFTVGTTLFRRSET